MGDEELTLLNTCTDLVSLRRNEAFPLHLLSTKRAGEWVGVRDVCRQLGMAAGDVKPELFAAWLPDPLGLDAYAVVLFYDDESKWTTAAHYNRQRLLASAAPNQTLPPSEVPHTVSPGTQPLQATPAAEL